MRDPSRFVRGLAMVSLLAMAATTRPAAAAWPHDPDNGNVALCTAAGDQSSPELVSDGTGGMIVAWNDNRGGGATDIYAQRVGAAGAPLWTANGVAVCTASGTQNMPAIVSDGAGGAIVTWYDYRGGNADIYVQRVSSTGTPLWTANGVALCAATGDQYYPKIVTDGAGGAIVAWQDARGGSPDIYAQRVSAAGVPQWTANGVALCTATLGQYSPVIAPDGAGGAIVAWSDLRNGANYDLYAQRVSAAGATQWTANGVAVSVAADAQSLPTIVADDAGGAIIGWEDRRNGNYDIYAQRVGAGGLLLWAGTGVVLCAAVLDQRIPSIASDGAGGAIVAWGDSRSGVGNDVYAQRVSAGGTTRWTADGVPLCTAISTQEAPVVIPDGAGGAIVAWDDYRSQSNYDIYAQRVSASGALQWAADGVALSSAVRDQLNPAITTDGSGGAIAAWWDLRNGSATDLYAQRIERFGRLGNPEPAITGVKDVKNDQGGAVKLSWAASYLDADPLYGVFDYRIWRSVPQALMAAGARPAATRDADEAAASGRYLVRAFAGVDYAWELVATQPAAILPGYSLTAPTTSDSVAAGNPLTAFMVEARASASASANRWFSAPDSGYSVDNLPPAAPAPFTGQYAAGTARLHWNRNVEADLAGYRLYRGSSVAFAPGPANLVAAPPDTGYADAAGAPYVYKLTAVDAHGNESPVATLVPSGTLGVDGPAPAALAFAAPGPNPARGETTLRWTLSRPGPVRLGVYDAAGRRVALLREGEMAAGEHSASFALRDEAGRELASGLYLVRLEAEGRTLTRRIAAVR